MMKNILAFVIVASFHSLLWSQTGIYKIDGNLEVTGDTQLDGTVGIGVAAPEHEVHLKGSVSPAIMVEATSRQAWNGAGIWLKTNSTDPNSGVTALSTHFASATDFSKVQFVIQKRKMDGAYLANILKYSYDLDQWVISPAGAVSMLVDTESIQVLKPLIAEDGLEVQGDVGIGTDSPDYKFHLKGISPAIQMIESSSANEAYSGAWTFYKTPTTDPDLAITAVGHAFAGSPDDSQFVIAQRDANGDVVSNLLVYNYGHAKWRFRPNNVNVFDLTEDEVKALKVLKAMEGMTVSNGLTADSITLDGVTRTQWVTSLDDLSHSNGHYGFGAAATPEQIIHIKDAVSPSILLESTNQQDFNGGSVMFKTNTNNADLGRVLIGYTLGMSSENYETTNFAMQIRRSDNSYRYKFFEYTPHVGRFRFYPNGVLALTLNQSQLTSEVKILAESDLEVDGAADFESILVNDASEFEESIQANKGVVLGNHANNSAGAIRWTGTNFEGYNGTEWKKLDEAGIPAAVNGDISMGPFN